MLVKQNQLIKRKHDSFPTDLRRLHEVRFETYRNSFTGVSPVMLAKFTWLMLIIYGSVHYRWNEFQLWIANLNIKPCKAMLIILVQLPGLYMYLHKCNLSFSLLLSNYPLALLYRTCDTSNEMQPFISLLILAAGKAFTMLSAI